MPEIRSLSKFVTTFLPVTVRVFSCQVLRSSSINSSTPEQPDAITKITLLKAGGKVSLIRASLAVTKKPNTIIPKNKNKNLEVTETWHLYFDNIFPTKNISSKED